MGAIGLACGFPSVRFGEIDADLPDADLTEADTSDGFDRAMADVFVEENEAGTRKDGEAKLPEDASCLSADPCDCDNDGYIAKSDACAGGNDCDDRDPAVHPNQTFMAESAEPPNVGDWDCSGNVEKQYVTNLKCPSVLGLACSSTQGFLGDPPCGAEIDYYACQSGLLSCTPGKIGTRRQGCK